MAFNIPKITVIDEEEQRRSNTGDSDEGEILEDVTQNGYGSLVSPMTSAHYNSAADNTTLSFDRHLSRAPSPTRSLRQRQRRNLLRPRLRRALHLAVVQTHRHHRRPRANLMRRQRAASWIA